jgi:hypothetical protein
MARRSSGPRLASGRIPDDLHGAEPWQLLYLWLGSPEQADRDYPRGELHELAHRPGWLDNIRPCVAGESRDRAVSGEIRVS